jgi:LexA-binding, inner membrane-associated putative hydrolase
MAGFRTHITTSAVLGCGYAGVGHALYDVPLDTAIVAGALCGFSGMLPDIDSDYGVPLRETIAFAAAIAPMMLIGRFETLALSHDAMVLVAVSIYLSVRFGVSRMIRKYTVHRGMFHSIPAGLIFAGVAFLVVGSAPIGLRCYKAGGVLAGFMSHLLLDEIYAVEWKGGRWRFKKSFGTALKVWGSDSWANFSTYAKLAIVAMMILGEPTVIERLETRHAGFAGQVQQFQDQLGTFGSLPGAQQALEAARNATGQYVGSPAALSDQPRPQAIAPNEPSRYAPGPPPMIQHDYGTAQRPAAQHAQ